MAKSKAQKRKTRAIAKAQHANEAVKAYTGSNYYGFGYGSSSTPDMRPDEYGAAQAYTFNVAVNAAIAFWESWLDGIVWKIKTDAGDKVLVSSDMRRYPKEGYGAKFANAIKFHEQGFKHSLFKSIAFSDMLYGETYIRYVCNNFHVPQLLEWLNPLAVEPDITMGYIRNYRYSAAEGYETLPPKEVAYRIAKRDANNDLRGQSRVIAVIDELNLTVHQKQAFKSYFKNNMQLGGVISPSNAETNLAPNQVMKMEDDLARNNKGSINAGKWVIAPSNMNITPFPTNDMEKNYAIDKPLQDKILMAMGVYPQLVGDPSNASYDNTDDMKRQWREMWGIPYAKEVQGYINDLILPSLEPYTPIYFDFDFSPYEIETPEVVSADFSAGFVDMYQAQELRGYDGDNDLKGVYLINGVPMAKPILLQVANTIPSQYALDYAQAQAAGQTVNSNADTALGIAKPITPALPSGEIVEPDIELSEPPIASVEPIKAVEHNHSHDTLPPIIEADTASELEELANWGKFLRNGKAHKRPFEQKALRGDIGDLLQAAIETHDKQSILDAFKAAQERIEARVKAIQATRLDFENSVADIMSKALDSNNYGRVQWSTAMRKIIRSACTRAYVDGLVNGGVLDGKLSESDQDTLTSHIANQSQYVTNLGDEIFKTKEGISEAMADRKPTLWFNKSVMPMYDAGQLSANGNRMMEFAGDDGEENCPTCNRLKGQRHRHMDWARKGLRPDAIEDSDNFECGLWECKHHLVPVKAEERGNW